MSSRRRRARLAGSDGSFTLADWKSLLAAFDYCCAYCGRSDVALEADHRTPLARGGSNNIANILPACRSCNGRKATKTEAEFREVAA